MYGQSDRFAHYKRATIYFFLYSLLLFFFTKTSFLHFKTLLFFLFGLMFSGAVAVLFMSIQSHIEKKWNPNLWFLNILIEAVGYYIYVQTLFFFFYLF
jgi:hypothetical protein